MKLIAEDAQDLDVISAHLQDAIVRVGDIVHLPRRRRLAMTVNRFCWETIAGGRGGTSAKPPYRRIMAGLHFDTVQSVQARGFDPKDREALLLLLTVQFQPGADTSGTLEFRFAGGATIRAEVECIDAATADIGEAWLTENLPSHDPAETSARGRGGAP